MEILSKFENEADVDMKDGGKSLLHGAALNGNIKNVLDSAISNFSFS